MPSSPAIDDKKEGRREQCSTPAHMLTSNVTVLARYTKLPGGLGG